MNYLVLRNAAIAASLGLLVACSAQTPDAASSEESAATAAPAPEATPAPTESAAPAETAAPADTAVASTEAAPAAAEGASGEAAYKKTCAMCHGTTALGAPVLGSKDDWKDRIAQGNDTLYKHAIEGFSGSKGVMPAKGGNPALDDATVKAAVDYMVSQSK